MSYEILRNRTSTFFTKIFQLINKIFVLNNMNLVRLLNIFLMNLNIESRFDIKKIAPFYLTQILPFHRHCLMTQHNWIPNLGSLILLTFDVENERIITEI